MKATDSHARTKSNRRSKSKWPRIYTRTYPNGQQAYMVDLGEVGGKRVRKSFPTKTDADTCAEQARITKRNEGVAAFALPASTRVEAVKCVEMLEPYGSNLMEAVGYYVKHVLKYRNAPTVSEIVERMVAEAEAAGRRERTVKDLRNRLERFGRTFGKRRLGGISLEELKAWLDDPTLSPRTRINYGIKLSQLFNYAVKNQWADKNLVESITRPSAEDKAPGIFTAEQASLLLEHADKSGLLPYVAIGLFGGLRSAELLRLDWSAVRLAERSIIVGGEVAKKRSRRVVEVNDTLAAWLAISAQRRGPVVSKVNFQNRLETLSKDCGLGQWPHNGLRHSFGSYHLALHGDAVKTAFQMGNSPQIVHGSYKALVGNGDLSRYWSLRPATDSASKIVSMNR